MAISLALFVAAALLANVSPVELFNKMVLSSFSNPTQFSKMLEKLAPLSLVGVGVYLALRAGLFNIGAEGQFLIGGLGAVMVGSKVGGPLGIIAACVCGAIAGGFLAWPAGWLKAKRGAHEVISTIMLNNIAILVVSALVSGPLKDPNSGVSATVPVLDSTHLPMLLNINRIQLNSSLLIALVVVALFSIWLKKSITGYEITAVGQNANAAKFAGIESARVVQRSMVASGAICGLAGALQLLAVDWSLREGFSGGYGFDGLGVALLAGANPFGLYFGGLLFAVLNTGATAVQFINVPKGIGTIVLAILIVNFAATRMMKKEMIRE